MALNAVHNSAAAIATRYLATTERSSADSAARLASGLRVVTARDDAASLAVGAHLAAEASALTQNSINMQQASSMLQIADGAAAKIGDILTRMKALTIQAGSQQLSAGDRSMVDAEFQQLKSEIDRIARATQFNGKGLVDDGGIVFTIRQNTSNGTVYLNGNRIGLNDTFTLSDVQNGRVTYKNASGSSDGLVVGVSKSDGTALGKVVGETSASSFEDAEYIASTGLNNIYASSAYARGGTGAGVTVAIIDSGVDRYHTDLDAQVVGGVDIVDGVLEGGAGTAGTTSGNGNDTNDGFASDGHGTHVAGIVAGERNGQGTMGVAYGASLLAIKATNRTNGLFNANDVADAIDYARLNGAKVINMSLSFGQGVTVPNQVTAAMVRAINAGVVIVAAAGNSALSDPDFPASFAIDSTAQGALIAVGATDDSNEIASFSNQAGDVKNFLVTAPGVNITSDLYSGNTSVTSNTVVHSGTSMAAPHVAGAAAILTQLYGSGTTSNLSGAEIASLIFSTTGDLGTTGIDATYGRGLINLDKATIPQLKLNINVTASSATSVSGQLNVVSGQSAALDNNSFGVLNAYESFSDSPTSSLSFKVGTGTAASDDLSVNLRSLSTLSLGISQASVSSVDNANTASTEVTAAINRLVTARTTIGASQNRLQFAADNVDVARENTERARSNLLDADMATELARFTSLSLLQQVGISALSQAQAQSRMLLKLMN